MAGVRMGFFTNNRWFSLEIFNSSCMGDWRCNDWKCTTNYICIYIYRPWSICLHECHPLLGWLARTWIPVSEELDPSWNKTQRRRKNTGGMPWLQLLEVEQFDPSPWDDLAVGNYEMTGYDWHQKSIEIWIPSVHPRQDDLVGYRSPLGFFAHTY